MENKGEIVKLRKENEALKKLCENYQAILAEDRQGIWEWDLKNDVYRIVAFSKEGFNYDFSGDITISKWKSSLHPEDRENAVDKLEGYLRKNKEIYENTYRMRTQDGDYRWVLSKGIAIMDEKDNVIKLKGFHQDISAKIELEEKLHKLAYYDPLTKLPNKEKLHIEFKKLIENKDGKVSKDMAFLFIDIDNLGYINNFLGYEEGNNIIKIFSEYLCSRYRNHLVSRVSADEFIVIYIFDGDLKEVETEMDVLLKEIGKVKIIDNPYIRVSVSVGVSIYKKHGLDFYDLFKNADIALHCAKNSGKDRYQLYHENMELRVYNNVNLVNQLRVGIEKQEFQMYYQPVVNARTGVLAGLEALIRWRHTINGFISPDKFIPIAEESGIMASLEKWIIEEVFKQVKVWVLKGDMPLFVSINLSSKGIIESNMVEFLAEMLEKYQISARKIQFEVTETAMIKSIEQSLLTLEKLGEMGFDLSLDDFGTGYSSLNYLKTLPVSKVKLDKSFIDGVTKSNKDQFMVKSIIALSHSFGLKVIAEGVEKENQVEILKEMECDYIQGYYYGKPLPVDGIEEWIRKNYTRKK